MWWSEKFDPTVSPSFPKPYTHGLNWETRLQIWADEEVIPIRKKWDEGLRGGEKVRNQNAQGWATAQADSTSSSFPFVASTATKDPTSGCITEEAWRHGDPEEPTAMMTNRAEGAHALRMPLPRRFCRKSLHTSVIPSTLKSRALDECYRTFGVRCFIKEIDSRAIPWLHCHVQHKSTNSFPKISTIQ